MPDALARAMAFECVPQTSVDRRGRRQEDKNFPMRASGEKGGPAKAMREERKAKQPVRPPDQLAHYRLH